MLPDITISKSQRGHKKMPQPWKSSGLKNKRYATYLLLLLPQTFIVIPYLPFPNEAIVTPEPYYKPASVRSLSID